MIVFPPLVAALLVVLWIRARDARLAALPDVEVGAPAAWTPTRVVVLPRRMRTVAVLAAVESWRVLRHPALVFGILIGMLVTGVSAFGADPFTRYVELTGGGAVALYVAPTVYFASAFSASRTRRAGATETFDATAATVFDRTLAQCLAALGPALLVLTVILATLAAYLLLDVELPATPPFWELLTLPLAVLGAGTLGVQTSRWLPFRGAPLLVFTAAFWATLGLTVDAPYLAPVMEWPEWQDDETYRMVSGLPATAHAFFTFGLACCAAIGALLTHPGRTRRPMLALGAVAVVGTTLAALAAT